MMTKYSSLALVGLAALPVNAFFLMPCWPVSTQRLDPLVDPGKVSSHVHQIAGGGAFAPAMNYSDTQAADCTTCFVEGDKSNYWIPAMFVKLADGSFEKVDQVGSASMYYFNEASRLGPGEKMEPFPKGLRMLAGDPNKRSAGTDFESLALNYKCLNYAGTPTDSKTFPTHDCADGVRAEVTFPSCWDGKNLDSEDHKSHMAYPTLDFENGACPSTHPHHLVTLKVEFIFDTHKYASSWINGKSPFVWSSGDMTGYGLHADYIMGWDYELLTSAVEQCFDEFGVLANCQPFAGKIKSAYVNPGTCKVDSFVDEDIAGTMKALPGCNQLTSGPGAAVEGTCDEDIKLKGKWADAQSNGLLSWLNWGDEGSNSTAAESSWSAATPAATSSTSSWASWSAASSASWSAASSVSWSAASSSWSASVADTSATASTAWAGFSATPQAFYGKANVPAAAPPVPSPAPAPVQDQQHSNGHVLTVTDLVTETTYVTAGSPAPATPAAAAASPQWGKWRREIGDDVHKHNLRRFHRRRGVSHRHH